MHSSSFAFINQFIITARPCAPRSLPSCLFGGLSVLPGAYGDIGVVTLGFMRHVMVCVITVFTPQCVSVCFCSTQRPTMSEYIYMIVTEQERVFLLWLIKVGRMIEAHCCADVSLFSRFHLQSVRVCVCVCVWESE